MSSGTVYEFRVAAVTAQGSSPVSDISAPLTTLFNRKNPPMFKNLKRRVEAAKSHASSKSQTEKQNIVPLERLPPLNSANANESAHTPSTGLTPRYDDDRVINDTALTFDHRHGTVESGSPDQLGNSSGHEATDDEVMIMDESGKLSTAEAGPQPEHIFGDEKARTLDAKEGRNLPYGCTAVFLLSVSVTDLNPAALIFRYGNLPLGERFENSVHSLNLNSCYESAPDEVRNGNSELYVCHLLYRWY